MNVTATITDETDGGCIRPVEIEKRRDCRIQLSFTSPKTVMPADLAAEGLTVDLNCFWILFAK
jgi:hypothetical protein